jgi:hypothetical protein
MIKKETKYELTQKEFEQLCELTAAAEELVRKSAHTNYDFFERIPREQWSDRHSVFNLGIDIRISLDSLLKLKYLLQSFGKHNVISNSTKGNDDE